MQVILLILANDKAEYFCEGIWTANAPNSLSGKSGAGPEGQLSTFGIPISRARS
jgi:hypothetical protein